MPAGKFNALKIEAEGRWTAELEPTQTVVQGAQSNYYGSGGVRNERYTGELESLKLAE